MQGACRRRYADRDLAIVVVAALLLGLDAMLGVVKDSGDVDLRPAAGAPTGATSGATSGSP